jgi:hypothetical protein
MPVIAVPTPDAPLIEWARFYSALGWPIFPCRGKMPALPSAHPPADPLRGVCRGECGNFGHGLYDATDDIFQIDIWWRDYPNANIGTPAGVAWFALDIDPRAGGDGTLFDLERRHTSLPHTLMSHTGGGGNHQLWQLPPGGITNKASLGPGIDVQGFGSYIILPPSLHPDTGRPYLWDVVDGPEDLMPQPAPDWLLALVMQPAAPSPAVDAGGPIADGTRDNTLSRLAIRMARGGVTAAGIRAAIGVENQRCITPMTEAELDRLCQGKTTAYPAFPTLIPPTVAAPGWSVNGTAPMPGPAPPDWRLQLAAKKSGGLIQDVRNISLILEHADFWRGQLWWDEVGSRPMFGQTRIDEDALVKIGRWFGTEEALSITNLRMLERCVLSQCRANRHDLLQAWLHQLPPWDHTPRLTTWLTDIAGVEATAYGQDVSRMLLLSMVARAMDPGCICRYVVILEGPEEVGKSTLVQALASEAWYVVLSIGLETKDAHMMLQNAWVAEMAELDSLTRTEETRLKAFITMRQDSYIPKYSNFRESHARRAIFVGTTNDESYLKGQTGNTRFLPVKITKQIDIEGFGFVREQLFAEALQVYRTAPEWWQMSSEGAAAAVEERERRRVVNVYEQPLHEWLEYGRFATPVYDEGHAVTFVPGETSWKELAQWFLLLKTPEAWKDQGLQKQVATALKTLGWHQAIIWRQGRTTRLWQKS